MVWPLLLALIVGGQPSVMPTGFAWDYDETHEASTVDVEWATFSARGVEPCKNLVLTPTVDGRCTASLVRTIEQSVRLRVNKLGVTSYSDWLLLPAAGQGSSPGVFRITFAGEMATVATTASRRFSAQDATYITSGISGAAAGNNVGGQASWTYAAWIKIAADGDGGTICGVWAEDSFQAVLLLNVDGSVIGWLHGAYFWTVKSPPSAIRAGQWHLVVLRHIGNGFSGALSLWIDDVKHADIPTQDPAPVGTAPFQIGAFGAATDHLLPFHGWLSSVGVWRATGVSDTDVRSLRSRYPSNPPAGLTFLTLKGRDEVVDYVGGMPLMNGGTAFSSDGPGGAEPLSRARGR